MQKEIFWKWFNRYSLFYVESIRNSLPGFYAYWLFMATFESVSRVAMNAKQRKQICCSFWFPEKWKMNLEN